MTFGKQARVALQDDLFKALAGFWQSLRRSGAPTPVKLAMLPIKAWAKVLHGGAGCVMSEARLGALRAKATQAIGIRPAGASSSLRLILAQDMCADPGFYQLWHLVNDLRMISVDWARSSLTLLNRGRILSNTLKAGTFQVRSAVFCSSAPGCDGP